MSTPSPTKDASPPPPTTTAPEQPSTVSTPIRKAVLPILGLVARLFTIICLLISLVIISTNTITSNDGGQDSEYQLKFNDFYAYRYMMSCTVFGIVHALVQTAFAILQLSTGNRLGGQVLYLIDFYGDKVISYMLATGAAAAFGLTVDLNRIAGKDSGTSDFLNKANVAASFLLLGFLFSAISSVFSSLALPKKG